MSAAASTADREIVITRLINAPRELVFEAWTDPKHLPEWWGPNGFTTTTQEISVKPGGVWRFIMHGQGMDFQSRIVYIEIVKPERLVYDHGDEADAGHFRVTVTFAEQGGKTKLTMRSVFKSAAERDEVVTKYHAIEGGNQTLDRLAEHLATQPAHRELDITRIFDAPREIVFKAWTEPERLQRWWGPKGFTNPVCAVDVRPGGAIRIHMRGPDGVVYPMTGVFHEIAAPERLVFSSSALDENRNPLFEVLITVTFSEHGGKTKLRLHASVAKATAAAAPHLAGMDQGWNQSLDRLSQEVSA